MKKIYLALAFLIAGFSLVANAYGEDEVYYCSDIDITGFEYNKKLGSYERSGFHSYKFKIKLVGNVLSFKLFSAGSG